MCNSLTSSSHGFSWFPVWRRMRKNCVDTNTLVTPMQISAGFFSQLANTKVSRWSSGSPCDVDGFNYDQNTRDDGAIRICKEHVRCLLRSANLQRRFWHFCRLYAFWPDGHGLPVWKKRDSIQLYIRQRQQENHILYMRIRDSYIQPLGISLLLEQHCNVIKTCLKMGYLL